MNSKNSDNNPFTAFNASTASKASIPFNRKVLVITYYWPPSGGAGVQRWLKFTKYLPEFGWEPLILTIDPEYAAYPVRDKSLESEIASAVKVFKTAATDYFAIYKKDKSKIPSAGFANNLDNSLKGKILRFIRGNFFIPDPRRGWNSHAYRKACEIIQDEGITHIITTSPPHSTQLIGLKLKTSHPHLHWHCDLRDPWTDIYYYKKFYPTLFSKAIDSHYEREVLRKADSITVTSHTQRKLFVGKVPEAENKTYVIPNGYDEKDFSGIDKIKEDKCTITYIGTISDDYPVSGIITALKTLEERDFNYKLRFTGMITKSLRQLITGTLGIENVIFNEYTPHKEAIRMMINTDFLLLVIPDVEGNKGVIPGKLFEYMAAGNPIICTGPVDCDAAHIIRENDAGATFGYTDGKGIADFIITTYKTGFKKPSVEKYSRYETSRQFTAILWKK